MDAWARGAPAAAEGDAPKKKRGPGGPGGSGPGPNSGAGPIILSFYVILSTGISQELGKYPLVLVRTIFPATLRTFPQL